MLTLTDLFAGAGGSSTGAVQSGRVEVRMAANHWLRFHTHSWPDGRTDNPRLCRACRLARGCRCWSCDWERGGRR